MLSLDIMTDLDCDQLVCKNRLAIEGLLALKGYLKAHHVQTVMKSFFTGFDCLFRV